MNLTEDSSDTSTVIFTYELKTIYIVFIDTLIFILSLINFVLSIKTLRKKNKFNNLKLLYRLNFLATSVWLLWIIDALFTDVYTFEDPIVNHVMFWMLWDSLVISGKFLYHLSAILRFSILIQGIRPYNKHWNLIFYLTVTLTYAISIILDNMTSYCYVMTGYWCKQTGFYDDAFGNTALLLQNLLLPVIETILGLISVFVILNTKNLSQSIKISKKINSNKHGKFKKTLKIFFICLSFRIFVSWLSLIGTVANFLFSINYFSSDKNSNENLYFVISEIEFLCHTLVFSCYHMLMGTTTKLMSICRNTSDIDPTLLVEEQLSSSQLDNPKIYSNDVELVF
ncbi:hypothetical protein HDU92_002281 [Lobulomyces angularis]|nr:hypothetical protein HDU92_002281 [Lobulomyces angularis]